ncbi:hypothetical protein KW803_03610 [Candidatus Saccharibacteria bacterium]|nr:hypothetical protein [Candidatus Saccharibacteria bacterium]
MENVPGEGGDDNSNIEAGPADNALEIKNSSIDGFLIEDTYVLSSLRMTLDPFTVQCILVEASARDMSAAKLFKKYLEKFGPEIIDTGLKNLCKDESAEDD